MFLATTVKVAGGATLASPKSLVTVSHHSYYENSYIPSHYTEEDSKFSTFEERRAEYCHGVR
jgi:hypothetical protein